MWLSVQVWVCVSVCASLIPVALLWTVAERQETRGTTVIYLQSRAASFEMENGNGNENATNALQMLTVCLLAPGCWKSF